MTVVSAIKVVFLTIDSSAYAGEAGPSIEAFRSKVSANPGAKAVFIEHGFLTEIFALISRDSKEDQVYVVGSELSPKALTALKDGYLDLIVDEEPYLNGYLPILNICLTKKIRLLRSPCRPRRHLHRLERGRCGRAAGRQGCPLICLTSAVEGVPESTMHHHRSESRPHC